jgi:hypothetical protein
MGVLVESDLSDLPGTTHSSNIAVSLERREYVTEWVLRNGEKEGRALMNTLVEHFGASVHRANICALTNNQRCQLVPSQ